MAAILTDVLGRPIRFEEGDREQEKKGFVSFGFSDAMAQGMIDMSIAKEAGLDNGLERTPENTTPISFRQWAEEVLKPALDARQKPTGSAAGRDRRPVPPGSGRALVDEAQARPSSMKVRVRSPR
jgi:hypothetical protein